MSLVVKNGLVVTPTGVIRGGIVAEDGIITHIGDNSSLPHSAEAIDAQGKWILPGAVDPHTHMGIGPADAKLDRIPSHWRTESLGAAHKGVSTIISFQGGSPIPMEELHAPMLDRQIVWAEENSYIDFALHVIMQTNDHLNELEALANKGVVGFKHFYTAFKPGRHAPTDRVTIGYADDGYLYECFSRLARLRGEGATVLGMVHAEDADICSYLENELKSAGRTDLAAWAEARPSVACLIRSQSAAEISRATGCPLYIVHVTTAEEVALLRRLRAEGQQVFGETCIHYLTHTMDMESKHGSYAKVVPAIKSLVDQEALWRGLADGILSTVGTDHCAWTKQEKEGPPGRQFNNIWDAMPGMTGMEYLIPVMMTFGVRTGRISIEQMVKVCSENPARLFGLYPAKGALQIGSDADMVIVDPNKKVTVNIDYHRGSITDWSVYDGWTFFGMPETTVIRGQPIVVRGEITGNAGFGRYVRRAKSG